MVVWVPICRSIVVPDEVLAHTRRVAEILHRVDSRVDWEDRQVAMRRRIKQESMVKEEQLGCGQSPYPLTNQSTLLILSKLAAQSSKMIELFARDDRDILTDHLHICRHTSVLCTVDFIEY